MTASPIVDTGPLTVDQARRLWALAAVLQLVAGRSVPIQVVERIAGWIVTGERAES